MADEKAKKNEVPSGIDKFDGNGLNMEEANKKGYIGEVPDENDYSLKAVVSQEYTGPLKTPKGK